MTPRIGHGLDAHRFAAGRRLVVGGVEVPHDSGLEGHSDGDVAAHALADAVLGAAGLGDLGRHFPSSDDRWRGADSLDLLARVAALVAGRGLRVSSAQVVVMAQQPRLSPYTETMAARLSAALNMPVSQLAVSATSTDGMGFVGRLEGIAASAVALLLPLD